MHSHKLIIVELVAALCLTFAVAATYKTLGNQDGPPAHKVIPVYAEQLPPQDGVSPVEVRCEGAHLAASNVLEKFSCIAINNTKKNLTALSSTLTVITENDGGGESRNVTLLYGDSFLHPDVREAHRLKSTVPGGVRTIQPSGPMTFDGEAIVRIELKLDYAEFDDNTSIGSDSEGARVIRSVREGAAGYKRWLVAQYLVNKKRADAIVPLLQKSEIPPELQLGGDKNLMEGAAIYRNLLRNVYESQGLTGLKKILDK